QVLAGAALQPHAVLEARLRAAVAALAREPARVHRAGAALAAHHADEAIVVELGVELEAILAQHVERAAELALIDVAVELVDEAREVELARRAGLVDAHQLEERGLVERADRRAGLDELLRLVAQRDLRWAAAV